MSRPANVPPELDGPHRHRKVLVAFWRSNREMVALVVACLALILSIATYFH